MTFAMRIFALKDSSHLLDKLIPYFPHFYFERGLLCNLFQNTFIFQAFILFLFEATVSCSIPTIARRQSDV